MYEDWFVVVLVFALFSSKKLLKQRFKMYLIYNKKVYAFKCLVADGCDADLYNSKQNIMID